MSRFEHTYGWRRKKNPSSSFWKKIRSGEFGKNLPLIIIALFFFGLLALLFLFLIYGRDLPDPNSLSDRSIRQSTKIFDRTGTHLLYEIHGDENRTLVRLSGTFCEEGEDFPLDPNGIPLFAVQATIAAEDKNFCSHHGFSITGILRAVVSNVRGNRVGGSTLTQQLVKNAILSNEKHFSRKIKELILSIEIERRYSKDEILQIYFNEIPYGSTNYGIEAAAQNYFGKSVKDITLAQAATLAALPQRPTVLLNNPDLLVGRRNWILDRMVERGFLSEADVEGAKKEEVVIKPRVSNITAPHFVFYVKQLLEETYGQRQVEEGGLKVITSLSVDMQTVAEETIAQVVEERGNTYGFENASLVAMDPKTGHILSMVGSRGYFDSDIDGQVNTTLRPLQPGSSFKPIVYASGFEKGYTPNTVLWDVETHFPTSTGEYTPFNYDKGQRGPVTVRKALQGSLNIPAVKMAYLVGVDSVLDFAQRLGYTTFEDRSRFGLAVALGGGEVTLLEHTNAFATFASDGMRHESVAILRVEDAGGTVLEEWKSEEGKRIFDANIARMISHVLSDNAARAYVFGLNSFLQLGNRPVAVKTGTTNDVRAVWTMGYTPSIAVGVWAGNNDNSSMGKNADGSSVAAPIWNAFMKKILADKPIESFLAPQIPVRGIPVLDGTLASKTVVIDKASGKIATEYTPKSYRQEKTFAQYHSILHFIDKVHPLNGLIEPPSKDPHYAAWEAGIDAWIKKQEEITGIIIERADPPTETDDVHVPKNFPTVSIESPANNTTQEDRSLSIAVNAFAARGISRVEYYLDGFYLGNSSKAPYALSTTIPNTIDQGSHTIKAVAYDDVDNSGSASVQIKLDVPSVRGGLDFIDPKNGQTIERQQNTYTVVVSLEYPTEFVSVSVYAREAETGLSQVIGTSMNPSSPFLTFPWTLPEQGDWILSAHAEKEGDGDLDTAGIIVTVIPTTTQEQPPAEEIPVSPETEISVPIIEEQLSPF